MAKVATLKRPKKTAKAKVALVKVVKVPKAPAKVLKAPAKAGLGKVERVILYVSDFDRAVRFYHETLALPLQKREEGWAQLGTQGTEICLHSGRKPAADENAPWIGFWADNFDATYAWLKEQGVQVGNIESPCGGIRIASFKDPDGNPLGIEGK